MLGRVLVVQGELQDSDTGGKDYFPSRTKSRVKWSGPKVESNGPGPIDLLLTNQISFTRTSHNPTTSIRLWAQLAPPRRGPTTI